LQDFKLVPTSPNPDPPVKLFISYSRKDSTLRRRLQVHLAGLERDGLIETWCDRDIASGTNWEQEISANLDQAEIVLLLISPNFNASDYCVGKEMDRALENMRAGRQKVIPIMLKPYHWPKAKFRTLQALPKNAKPVTRWQNLDDAFLSIAEGIGAAASEVKRQRGIRSLPPETAATVQEQARVLRQLLISHRARSWAAFAFVGVLFLALLTQYSLHLLHVEQSDTRWPYALVDLTYFLERKSVALAQRGSTDPITVITIQKDLVPQPCERRELLSRVLGRIRRLEPQPRVVVLDLWFPKSSCDSKDQGTSDLLKAIQSLADRGVRVVIGQNSEDSWNLRRFLSVGLQLKDPDEIRYPYSPNISQGLVRLNYDLQLLPLTWPLVAGDHEVEYNSICLSAALAFKQELRSNPAVATLLSRKEHPLVSLSPITDFKPVSAPTVLCGERSFSDWRQCIDLTNSQMPAIGSQILFIGLDDPNSSDYFETVAGQCPGVVLQANYTLALLQGAFYSAISWPIQFTLAALFVGLLEVALQKAPRGPEFVMVISLLTTVIVQAVAAAILIGAHQYFELWIPLVPIFIIRYGVEQWKLSGISFPIKRGPNRSS
jgi:hypothetical protein